MTRTADCIVIGAGIAGAAAGFFLAPHLKVLLVEQEAQPGFHSTGRSAALFMESYGTPQVRALTMASRAFFEQPPEGFAEHPLLGARGAMMVASHGQEAPLHEHWAVLQPISPRGRLLDAADDLRPRAGAAARAGDRRRPRARRVRHGRARHPPGLPARHPPRRRRAAGRRAGHLAAPRGRPVAGAGRGARARGAAGGERRRRLGRRRSARSPARGRSACSRSAARPSSSRRPKAWPAPPGR